MKGATTSRARTTKKKKNHYPLQSSSHCRGGWAFHEEGALVDRKEVLFTAEIMESAEKTLKV